ncbi:hypothetical protein TNCV_664511 [Trichonephila clavipes]|nr:hypothetical protein TNCV_664511 [Trichonephila clavipes]
MYGVLKDVFIPCQQFITVHLLKAVVAGYASGLPSRPRSVRLARDQIRMVAEEETDSTLANAFSVRLGIILLWYVTCLRIRGYRALISNIGDLAEKKTQTFRCVGAPSTRKKSKQKSSGLLDAASKCHQTHLTQQAKSRQTYLTQ